MIAIKQTQSCLLFHTHESNLTQKQKKCGATVTLPRGSPSMQVMVGLSSSTEDQLTFSRTVREDFTDPMNCLSEYFSSTSSSYPLALDLKSSLRDARNTMSNKLILHCGTAFLACA